MKSKPEVKANCRREPKIVRPLIDAHRCEGKGDCVRVCPYDVFAVRGLTRDEKKALPWGAWLKVMAHGGAQGFVVEPDACHACGACVAACPEKAIRLVPAASGELDPKLGENGGI